MKDHTRLLKEILTESFLWKIYGLAASTQVIGVFLGMIYFYLFVDLPNQQRLVLIQLQFFLTVCSLLVQYPVLIYLNRYIRRFIFRNLITANPDRELIQNLWLEIVNFPLLFVFVNSLTITSVIILFPAIFYAVVAIHVELVIIHICISSVITIVLLSLLQFQVYEIYFDGLLREIEYNYSSLIYFRDYRIKYITLMYRLLVLGAFIIGTLALFIGSFSYHAAREIYLNHDFAELIMQELKVEIIFTTTIILSIGLLFTYLITSVGSISLQNISEQMKSIKGGFLEIDLIEAHTGVTRNEITNLITTFYETIKRLQDFVGQIKGISEEFEKNTGELMSISNSQYKRNTQKTRELNSLSSAHEKLLNISREIKTYVNNINAQADTNFKVISVSSQILQDVKNTVNLMQTNSQINQTDVIELKKKLQRIVEIINKIRNIAEQTKIIAFNASIESSSNQKIGLRYNIIAEEIRSLTLNVTESTDSVAGIISSLVSNTGAASSSINNELNILSNEATAIDDALNSLDTIWGTVCKMIDTISHFVSSANYQLEAGQHIFMNLNELNDYNTRAEQFGQEVNLSCQRLAQISIQMREYLNRFQWQHKVTGSVIKS